MFKIQTKKHKLNLFKVNIYPRKVKDNDSSKLMTPLPETCTYHGLFHSKGPYYIETRFNFGFCMIGTSVVKVLRKFIES